MRSFVGDFEVPALNIDLVRQIREQVTDYPESHDQNTWGTRTACGTTHCTAGWAAVLTRTPEQLVWSRCVDGIGSDELVGVLDDSGEEVDVERWAHQAMGLTWPERNALFSSYATDVPELLGELLRGRRYTNTWVTGDRHVVTRWTDAPVPIDA